MTRKGFVEHGEKPRRFWTAATVGPREAGGWPILLDGRPVRTPGGAFLLPPTQALAALVAGEWDAQGEHIDMASMPVTRLAQTAIDRVAQAREAVADEVARYAGSDALCYLAEAPQALAQRQAAAWTPWLEWAQGQGVTLSPTIGLTHRAQPGASIRRVRELALAMDDFALAGLAYAVPLFGSAVLGLALAQGAIAADEGFELSRLDETFQEEQWGVDAEAAERTAGLRAEAHMLERWFEALRI